MSQLSVLTVIALFTIVLAQESFHNSIAHLSLFNAEAEAWSCTSSIIGDRWLLTAGHCLRGPGSANLDMQTSHAVAHEPLISASLTASHRRYFRAVYIHKNFRGSGFFSFVKRLQYTTDDIGIVELEERLSDGAYGAARIAPLPTIGSQVVQVGYGREEDEYVVSESRVIVQAFSKCYMAESFMRQMLLSSDRHLCTVKSSSERVVHCNADFGGPLLMRRDGRVLQIGIASFGRPECQGPTWYTRLDRYVAIMEHGALEQSFEKLDLAGYDRAGFEREQDGLDGVENDKEGGNGNDEGMMGAGDDEHGEMDNAGENDTEDIDAEESAEP